ncbi:MAG: hypothetical protein NT080_09405 [Spirochaetes bacterium]|nr:hypothetical protein [Spirochaetota bacterium]
MQKISKEERAAINRRWIQYGQSDINFRATMARVRAASLMVTFLFLAGSFFFQRRQVRIKTRALRETVGEKGKPISDARFSLGICPDCTRKLHGDILSEDELNRMR